MSLAGTSALKHAVFTPPGSESCFLTAFSGLRCLSTPEPHSLDVLELKPFCWSVDLHSHFSHTPILCPIAKRTVLESS